MIQKTQAFKTSDGQTFEKIQEAQVHEIKLLLPDGQSSSEEIASMIVIHADKIVDVLTTTARSKVLARKINGGRKQRRAVTAAEAKL